LDEEHVRFVGFVDEADAPAIYRGATTFIYPSRYEGFGLPALEAMACGTPVVGSDASSIPEIVGDGGLLLPPDDIEGMAKALVRLATDDSLYVEMGSRALAQAAKFTWKQTAQETLAAYRDVVDVVNQA
jgi:glycosyltransferase involved in cell wall biosynthesis